ncbi:TPA: ribbon-helix-helix protein, CopG family [Bacillus anthracis]|nr:ribbon-helix-helix protein, CopG family [Bacillus anthracis]
MKKIIDGVEVNCYSIDDIDTNNFGYIYVTHNTILDKYYVGMSRFDKVFKNTTNWRTYIGSSRPLLKDVKQYGRENFTRDIIAIAKDEREMRSLERVYIDKFKAVHKENWYNRMHGGTFGSDKVAYQISLRFNKNIEQEDQLAKEFDALVNKLNKSKNDVIKDVLRFYLDNKKDA